jgi:hypothetical protein
MATPRKGTTTTKDTSIRTLAERLKQLNQATQKASFSTSGGGGSTNTVTKSGNIGSQYGNTVGAAMANAGQTPLPTTNQILATASPSGVPVPGVGMTTQGGNTNPAMLTAQRAGPGGVPLGPAGSPPTPTMAGSGAYSKQFLPSASGAFAQNPEVLLADMISRRFANESNQGYGMYAQLEPLAEALGGLFLLDAADNPNAVQGGSWIDYAGKFWQDQMNPGGGINVRKLLGNLFDPTEGGAVQGFLQMGDPAAQVNNFRALMGAATLGGGTHPLLANTLADQTQWLGQQYQSRAQRGETTPFNEWLMGRFPQLAMLGR